MYYVKEKSSIINHGNRNDNVACGCGSAGNGTGSGGGYTVTQVAAVLYATDSAYVYEQPTFDSASVTTIGQGIPVGVTGITSNGWFVVDIGGTYYVPGYGLSATGENVVDLSDTQPTTTTSTASSSSSSSSSKQLEVTYTEDSTISHLGSEVGTIIGESETGIPGTVDIETPYGTLYGIETSTTIENMYDKEAAQYFAQSVNELRVQNGLNALTWSDSLYSYAIERCNTDDGHAAFAAGQYNGIYGSENACTTNNTDPETYWQFTMDLLTSWLESSPGHYANAMNSRWTETAVGVRYYKSTSSDTWTVLVYQLFK